MASARIINFPRAARRRIIPQAPAPRYPGRPNSQADASGFILLLFLTMPAAFLYLSGAVDIARHDTVYAVVLAAVWSVYFLHEKLLRTRLGPLLMRVGRLLMVAAAASFFGGIYWLIFRNG